MKKQLLLLFASVLSLTTKSQIITITQAQMPSSGDTCRYSNASLSSVGDYTATGTNFNWNFSALDSTGQGMRKFEPATSTPYVFFGSGYGEKIADSIGFSTYTFKNIYNFYKKTSTKCYVDGLGMTFSGFPIPNFYSDKDELYMFPLTYGNPKDSTTFKFKTLSTGTTIPTYSKEGYRITEVDGWGTITTPYGTAACLRILTTQYSQDSIKGTVFGFPLNIGFPNYARSYQWLTLGEKIPYLEVSGTVIGGNFNPTQARYRDKLRSFVGIKEESISLIISVFPNPSTGQLNIITPKNDNSIKAELIDVQGKIVLSHDLTNNSNIVNQHQLDVSSLAKGLYILNLSNLKGKQSLKISIQ